MCVMGEKRKIELSLQLKVTDKNSMSSPNNRMKIILCLSTEINEIENKEIIGSNLFDQTKAISLRRLIHSSST